MRVAIPTHPFYTPLITHADAVARQFGLQLRRGSELECAVWLKNNAVSLALLSPLGYGLGVQRVDYRIIAGPVLELDNCTHTASIYLNPSLRAAAELRFASPAVEDFLIRLGTFMFQEKYDRTTHLFRAEGTIDKLLQQYDGVVAWGFDPAFEPSLDISEEWRDLTNAPLPAAVWVCRPEDMRANVATIVKAMQDASLPEERIIHCQGISRTGSIRYHWGEYTEEALALVLEFLFYYQQLPRIPAVKIWGRDPFEE